MFYNKTYILLNEGRFVNIYYYGLLNKLSATLKNIENHIFRMIMSKQLILIMTVSVIFQINTQVLRKNKFDLCKKKNNQRYSLHKAHKVHTSLTLLEGGK